MERTSKRASAWSLLALGLVLLTGCGGSKTSTVVQGRVVDGSGLPLYGVQVVVGSTQTYTDSSGRFSFIGLSTGSHVVVGVLTGYQISPVIVNVPTASLVTLTATRTTVAPTLSATVSSSTIDTFGGTVTLTAVAASPLGNALTVNATAAFGSTPVYFQAGLTAGTWVASLTPPNTLTDHTHLPFTATGALNTYSATVTLPGNTTTLPKDFVFAVAAQDGALQTAVTVKVTAAGLLVPGGVTGGTTPGGGGPPIPSIR